MHSTTSLSDVTWLFNGAFAFVVLTLLFAYRRRASWQNAVIVLAVFGLAGIFVSAVGWRGWHVFYAMRIAAYGIFVHGIILLAGISLLSWRAQRGLSIAAGMLAAIACAVAIDAFLVEPTWLQTTHYVVHSRKLDRPIRIVVVADLQTDDIGRYERESLKKAMELKPDLLLLAGDYLQAYFQEPQARLRVDFRRLLEEAGLQAPMGVFAIRGNTEWDGWRESFEGLGIQAVEPTETFNLEGLALTCLSMDDSFDTRGPDPLPEVKSDEFHLILGHSPNCALAEMGADLIVCGHTHGGQVCLPGVGPLLTMSEVPRQWASGLREIRPGTQLFVSRGVGHERGDAPRLRFLCRPELAVIELIPSEVMGRKDD